MVSKQSRKILRHLGEIIHEERVVQGYSQSELAEKTGLSRYYISSIEHGGKNISLAVFREIAVALKAKTWRLLKKAEVDLAA
jgi:transcriptional regulator with XRE-family HTH domain